MTSTQDYLKNADVEGRFTFQPTGFRNHNDAWLLRPTSARLALRKWLKETLDK